MSIRPETGPMQFTDDWPGVFIRGDTAQILAQQLAAVIGEPEASCRHGVEIDSLEGLLLLLRSASKDGVVCQVAIRPTVQ
jgi:hypothetical protein